MSYGVIKVDTVTFTNNSVDQTISVSGIIASISGNLTVTGTVSGTTVQGTYGSFTSLTGVTTSGTNANFQTITGATGVFTTSISGATGTFTSLTGITATFTSGIIASGTAALPSLAILSDPNTGIYSSGADELAISTNGTGRVFVNASGNVGVGIGSPVDSLNYGSTLDIRGSTTGNGGVIYLGNSDATVRGFIAGYGDGRFDFGTSTNHPVKFFTNSSEKARIRADGLFEIKGAGTAGSSPAFSVNQSAPANSFFIDSGGKLGLGTSSPGDILHVKGGSTYAGVIADNSAATGGGAFRAYRNGVQKAIFCVDSWVTGTSSDDAAIYTDAGGGIKFYTNNSSTAKAVLTSAGLLGIGTTTVSSKLHVAGGGSGSRGALRFSDDGGTNYWEIGRDNTNTGDFTFNLNSSEKARIDTSGRLLVGTSTSQGSYNLQCFGTGVWGQGAYVNGSDASIKQNVSNLPPSLDVVKNLRPVTFEYKPEYSQDQTIQAGFIAQELREAMQGQDYLDGIVQQGTNHLNVAYQSIIPVLTKALQEAIGRIETLEAEVAALKGA